MLYHPDSSHISESVKLEKIDGEYALTGSDFELFLPSRSEVRHKYELWYWPSEKHRSGRDLAIDKLKGRASAFDGFKYIGRGQMSAYNSIKLWKEHLSFEQNMLLYGSDQWSKKITTLKDGSAQLGYQSKPILVDNVAYSLKGTTIGYKDYGNGSYYEGELFNDKPDGKGLMVRSNNDEYQGDWEDGKYHGQGTYKFASGSIYSGDWVNGTREGKGELRDVSGWRYVGDWKNDVMEGEGDLFFSAETVGQAGTWYSGNWSNGEMTGYGTIYGADSVIIQTGTYANSKLIRGRMVTTNWSHDGDNENGKASGKGTRTGPQVISLLAIGNQVNNTALAPRSMQVARDVKGRGLTAHSMVLAPSFLPMETRMKVI